MPLNFRSFPDDVTVNICRFLDTATYLRLREDCKMTKEFVEKPNLLCTRKTIVTEFEIRRENETMLFFACESDWDYLFLKLLISYALAKHENRNFRKIYWHKNEKRLSVTLSSEEIKEFFKNMRPLIESTQFLEIFLNDCQKNIVEYCIDFLGGKSIPIVVILQCEIPIKTDPWIRLIQKLNPNHLHLNYYAFPNFTESIEVMLKFADLVKSIGIFVLPNCNNARPDLFSIVRNILIRKCESLDIGIAHCSTPFMSLPEAEKLVQLFHSMDKKVKFKADTFSAPIEIKSGVYKVEIIGWTHPQVLRKLSIEHLENV